MSVLGLPINRAIACVPDSRSLSWAPLTVKVSDVINWRSQALGTSMVMGFLLNNNILSEDLAQEQVAPLSTLPPPRRVQNDD